MANKREMAMVVKKMTFAEADEDEIFQWQNVPFEEKWKALEQLRRMYYSFHNLPYPERMERVFKKRKRNPK